MRGRGLLTLFLLGLAAAVGRGDGGDPDPREALCRKATASPGYVQEDFVGDLAALLGEAFGERRAAAMLAHLRRGDLEPRDALRLLNGQVSRRATGELFGAHAAERKGAREVVTKAVARKDRKVLFGILFVTMVRSFDVAPSSDFCKQVVAARDAMSDEDFDRVFREGARSRNAMRDAFGLTDRDDQKFMSRVVAEAMQSDYLGHPMCASLGGAKARGRLPKLARGMTGYGRYADGKAGGLPFDATLPPLPILSDNVAGEFE